MKTHLSEKNILQLIIIIPIFGIILTSIILTNIFINNEKNKYENDIVSLKIEHLAKLKHNIKNRIDRLVSVIDTRNKENLKRSKEEIVDIVNIGYKIIEDSYDKYKNLGKDKVFIEIRRQLRELRYFANDTGYFFVYDYEGNTILLPIKPELEGTNQYNLKDSRDHQIVKESIDIARNKKEDFHTWHFYKNSSDTTMQAKIGYIKGFEPLKIFIGTAKYEDEIIEKNKEDAIVLLNSIKYDKYGYVFAMDTKGTTLAHNNKEFIGRKITEVSGTEHSIITNILNSATNHPEGNYLQYTPTSFNMAKNLSDKISYVKKLSSLNWIIGTGSYTQDLKNKINKTTLVLEQNLDNTIRKTIYSSTIVTIPLIFIMLLISYLLKNILNKYAKELSFKNKSLKDLNESLEQRISEEVQKNREKDDMVHQSSKLAAMGEMLGNIAHQWRQPLSAISTSASGIKMQKEFDILTDDLMNKELDTIVRNTQTLSQTIDDFRDFFQQNKKMETFKLQEAVDKVLLLISANLTNKDISIIQEIEDIEIYHSRNELVQALLNILNNAKDILVDKPKKEKRFIFIKIYSKNDNIIISVKDNGGGVKEPILCKIFEPYFTTKFASQGTGIGLHMTREIIEKTYKGFIDVKNVAFTYKNEAYFGAEFIIKFKK